MFGPNAEHNVLTTVRFWVDYVFLRRPPVHLGGGTGRREEGGGRGSFTALGDGRT